MPVLHFGVVDFPYADPPAPIRKVLPKNVRKNLPPRGSNSGKTTGEVAEILEDKYHIMQLFAEESGTEAINAAIEHSIAGALENIMLGGPTGALNITADAESEIEDAFKLFLSLQLLDGIEPGVPTQAALNGVSHRFKHPYAKRGPRPSFIDTGTYQASFKVWCD